MKSESTTDVAISLQNDHNGTEAVQDNIDHEEKGNIVLSKKDYDDYSEREFFRSFLDEENYVPFTKRGVPYKSLYQYADRMEERRIFEGAGKSLESIAEEIKVRCKITANEVFKIGELLITAKKLCQEQQVGFRLWIKKNCDFSNKMANNFMNVFKSCLGYKKVALAVPPSILYKISEPSCPDELRAWLFDQGNLEKLTNGKCQQLIKKFKEEGLEAIEQDVEDISRDEYVRRQINNTVDQAQKCVVLLNKLQKNIQEAGGRCPFTQRVNSYEPVARDINVILCNAVIDCVERLDTAVVQSKKIFAEYQEAVQSKM